MRSTTLLARAAFCATAFVVFSLHHQFATLNNATPLGASRSATGLPNPNDGFNAHYLRSIANKEDVLLQKIEEMSAQVAEMKKFTDEWRQINHHPGASVVALNQEQVTTTTANAQLLPPPAERKLSTVATPVLTAAASATTTSFENDRCHAIRTSTSSMFLLIPYGGDCKHHSLLEYEQQPKPLSVSTVIPGLAREKDIAYFPKVLQSLQDQTVPSDEIVIALSGVFDQLGIRYKHKMHNEFSEFEKRKAGKFCRNTLEEFAQIYTKSPIKLLCIGERLSSGRARNAAIAAASSDILAFIDSDDTAYPIRNEVVRNIFNDTMPCRKEEDKPPLLLLLHSHKRSEKKGHPYEKARGYTLPPTNKVLPGTQWTGQQCLEQEDGLELQHGRKLLASMAGRPSSWKIADEVANGHPVIRRAAFDRAHFSSIPKGQDIILLRDLMYTMSPQEAEQSVLFINRPLTTYYAAGNANSDLRNVQAEMKEKEKQAKKPATTTTTKKDTPKNVLSSGATKEKEDDNNNNNNKEKPKVPNYQGYVPKTKHNAAKKEPHHDVASTKQDDKEIPKNGGVRTTQGIVIKHRSKKRGEPLMISAKAVVKKD